MKRLRSQSRLGFTLVEILVVVGIIALLVAIAISVIGRTVTNSRIARTKTTIKKIDEMLRKRMAAFQRGLKTQDRPSPAIPDYAIQYRNQGYSRDIALVLGRKNLFRNFFPQQFSENGDIPAPGASHVSDTESSEAMYFFLTNVKSESYGVESVEAGEFTSSEVGDTDGDGLLEFIDGWGQPLRFYRWPTRLIRPQASGSEGTAGKAGLDTSLAGRYLITTLPQTTGTDNGANPLAQDPDDPRGLLSAAAGSSAAGNFESSFHTVDSYHTPLIVSPGADGRLGLYEPNDSTNFGRLAQPVHGSQDDLFDNITNHKDAAGGGGN